MVERLEGVLVRTVGPSFFLQVGPVTLEVLVPVPPDAAAPPPGGTVSLWTHLQWKEDGPVLFGFGTPEERKLFRLLLQVQGVGPRTALAILAHFPPARLVDRLRAEDDAIFTTVPGVGRKTAGRILVELGPQAEKLALTIGAADRGTGTAGPRVSEDARQALTALGYPAKDADRALARVLEERPEASLEEQVRLALRELTQSPTGNKR